MGDQGMDAPHDLLGDAEEVLVEFFAGPEAGVDDVDVPARLADEPAGDVVDEDRLAHVEDESLPGEVAADPAGVAPIGSARSWPAVEGGGLDHELDGFVDGHEVAA